MKFEPLPLKGACLIELDRIGDDRGFFARVFCTRELAEQGLKTDIVQINSSFSSQKGTLRGMHYQLPPAAEVKVVRCIRGALHDVILDLRPESETFGQSCGADLTAENRRMMYVPEGFAHGFQTLEENTEALYFVTAPYTPSAERGIRWNDPRFSIRWPLPPTTLSEKDASHRDWDPEWHLQGL